jgi:uncharacterized protein YyaL (SSP411 family)
MTTCQCRSVCLATLLLTLCSVLGTGCKSGHNTGGTVPKANAEEAKPAVKFTDVKGKGGAVVPKGLKTSLLAALRAKPVDYKPRTVHFKPDGSPKYLNRLILETSPYLLQHAHNPVDWSPWGDEAFERSKREDKPVLLSIGYSTCHWCHVMERESFEDEEIAAYINANFIAIKVDREERPDVDDIYMKAVQMFTGRGGWPMTTLLTPSREPFFGGTYFPARDGDRGSRKGFLTILRELKTQYTQQRETLLDTAAQMSRRIANSARSQRPGQVPGAQAIEQAVKGLAERFDKTWGGFGRAPKFPTPVNLELLLRYYRRTGDTAALKIATVTLKKMAQGGMYDHVAGGFHRYSTDQRWLVPHFEKMLYDNAQLVPVYLDAFLITGDTFMRTVVVDTLDYIRREMINEQGGFYSATDADSPVPGKVHQEEGWYFTWTPAEMDEVLGTADSGLLKSYYRVTQRGNFEGRNILHTRTDKAAFAIANHISLADFERTLVESKEKLYQVRLNRQPPLRDDKVIASWNGLMISAFARAGFALNEPKYVETAARSADFLLKHLVKPDHGLHRTFMDLRARHPGVLDDYAFVTQGLLDLFEATSQARWLESALSLQTYVDAHHWDQKSGGYFMTGDNQEKLLSRDKPDYDGAEPSGNSVAVMNLLRFATLTSKPAYRTRAESVFAAFSQDLARRGRGLTKMLSALELYLDEPYELVVVSKVGKEDAAASLLNVLRSAYLPNRALVVTTEGSAPNPHIPWLENKTVQSGSATAYVCKQGICKRPALEPKALKFQLETAATLYDDRSPEPIEL